MCRAKAEQVTVAILAKAPVPGVAKTRLAPVLGVDGAAALQARLTAHAAATACAAALGPVHLWATDITHPSFDALRQLHGLSLYQQPDRDLGARMLAAVDAAGPTLIIGTDCPVLTPAHLRAAAAPLRNSIDAVLIPAEDGGYVLIGVRAPNPVLFTDMTWSRDDVAAETRRRLARAGLSWREPARLWDVDRPEDLARLEAAGLLPRQSGQSQSSLATR